mgnify:CR=1 FL=1
MDLYLYCFSGPPEIGEYLVVAPSEELARGLLLSDRSAPWQSLQALPLTLTDTADDFDRPQILSHIKKGI